MIKNKVLLIEDEAKTAEMLKLALEGENIEVEWAASGEEGLKLTVKGKFDLIILDLKLPGIMGEKVLEEIRKIDPYVEVIIYTNYENPPVMRTLINLGVDGYIKKGADADLWETVSQIKRKLEPVSKDVFEELVDELSKDVNCKCKKTDDHGEA